MGVLAEFVRGEQQHAHAAQIYSEPEELAEAVAACLAAGFETGEPALVVATRENVAVFLERLAASGWHAARLEADGLLVLADADATLRSILRDGRPSDLAFDAVVGTLVDQLAERAPGKNVRVFGEMVSVLCERGDIDAAAPLEELWNALLYQKRFSLLCGYRLDVFDRETQLGTLPGVCGHHTHIAPAPDELRFRRAVEQAFEETLGTTRTGQVYAVVAEQARARRVPIAQLGLMWISRNTPALAERILTIAKARYEAMPRAAAG